MYFLLKNSELKKLIREALKKAGSYNELSKNVKIGRQKIWYYQTKNVAIKEERLNSILDYLGIKINKENIENELPNNWRQVIGGKNCVKKKIKDGTLNEQLKSSRKNIKKTLSDWHKDFKEQDPKAYHILQYEHFKKIGSYKFVTDNKEKVRNILERDIANILKKLNLSYKYENIVKAGGKYFFPDFLIDNKIIVECTMWKGYDKAIKLADKINKLKDKYRVYVVIPTKLKKYYTSIEKYLVLGIEDFSKLARTFN